MQQGTQQRAVLHVSRCVRGGLLELVRHLGAGDDFEIFWSVHHDIDGCREYGSSLQLAWSQVRLPKRVLILPRNPFGLFQKGGAIGW